MDRKAEFGFFKSIEHPWSCLCLCALVAILPLTHTIAIRLILLAITSGLAGHAYIRRHRLGSVSIPWGLFAWATIGVASLAWSLDAAYSRGEVINEIGYAALIGFSAFLLVRSEAALNALLIAIAGGCSVVSVIAIVRFFPGLAWASDTSIGAGDRNAFSTTGALVIPALVYAATWPSMRRFRYRLLVPGIIVISIAAALTLNRMMWPAVAASIMVFYLVSHRLRTGSILPSGFQMLIAALIIAGAGTLFLAGGMLKRSDLTETKGVLATVTHDSRFEIWNYAIQRAVERPVAGHGFGRGILRKDFREALGEKLHWHAHNLLLNQVIELGVLGVSALLIGLYQLARQFTAFCRSDNHLARRAGILGLGLITAMLVRSMADDTIVRENSLLFWSLIGALLGTGADACRRATMPAPAPAQD